MPLRPWLRSLARRATICRSRKGIRIGSARDGAVTALIEDMESASAAPAGAEAVGVDAQGNVYGGVIGRRMLERHTKTR